MSEMYLLRCSLRQKSGAFPDLPNEEEGGSAALFDPDFVPPPKAEKDDKKGKGKKGKKDKKEKDEKKKKKKKGEEDEGFIMQPSKFVPVIMETCMEYDGKFNGLSRSLYHHCNPMDCSNLARLSSGHCHFTRHVRVNETSLRR